MYIKLGEVSIVDTSVIATKQSRPKQGKDGKNTQDPEARWSVEVGADGKRKSTDGYKAHDNVDGARFIKVTDYSTGSLHDSNCFTGLLTGDRRAKPCGACVWCTQATPGDSANPLRGNETKSNTD